MTAILHRNRLLAAVLAGLTWSAAAFGWGCDEAHPAINELAGKLFIVKSQGDAFGDKYKRAPIEHRTTFEGVTFKKGGLSEKSADTLVISANFIEWLRRGGHDADIPGIVMGFRHFYDPVYEPHYLTWLVRRLKKPDRAGVSSEEAFFEGFEYRADDWNPNKEWNGVLRRLRLQPKLIKPRIDGITWVLSHPDNDHSWRNGLLAYKAAMENDCTAFGGLSRERLFARAFRSLGETMHMVGDMTQPAHTRADSHSLFEPVEGTVGDEIVRRVIGDGWKNPEFRPTGDYTVKRGLSPEALMKSLAVFTNSHFFSNDTIADYKKWVFPRNKKRPYPAPALSRLKEESGTYGAEFADVGWVPLAKETGSWFSVVLFKSEKVNRKNPKFNVTKEMAEPQAKVLIPLAVWAASELIDAFFPTLELAGAAKRTDGNTYLVSGELKHIIENDAEWQKIGEIRYAGPAVILVNGTRRIPCTFADGRLEGATVTADAGDTIRIVIEAGARIIRSEPLPLD
ncbi:MAG TPA: hypothetical protein VIV61_14050 [Candidatus Ozemobacteraceae bacterium]